MTYVLYALVPCIAVTQAAFAQASTSARKAERASVQPKSEPPSPTAEDVLRTLKHRRPVNDVIPPASRAARDALAGNPAASNPLLLPEGLSIVGRTGRLSPTGQWWIFAFDDDASLPPMKLLPNANLELMVNTLRQHQSPTATLTGVAAVAVPIRFAVTGELTVFDGENFLFPRAALRAADDSGTPLPRNDAAPSPGQLLPEASAADVLATMQALQPKETILPLGVTASAEEGSSQSASDSKVLLFDGSPVMNRVGRLVRLGSWWTLVTDSDRPEQPEPPLRLLPNQRVEMMIEESQHGGGVFIVSGEVTSFDGENYLLTRVATRRANTGNFRK